MNTRKKNHWRRTIKAAKKFVEYTAGFAMLCITHVAIFHPSYLDNPVFLLLSIFSFIYTLSTPTGNFGQADNVYTYRTRLLETAPGKEQTGLFYFQTIQNIMMYSVNILHLALIASIVMTPTTAFIAVITSYATFLAISALRDYISQEYALDFIAHHFTDFEHIDGPRKSIDEDDSDELHHARKSVQQQTIEHYKIGCEISKIIETNSIHKHITGALIEPLKLVNKSTHEEYWVERTSVQAHIHRLENYLHYDYRFPDVQKKIQEIREVVETTAAQHEKIQTYYSIVDTLFHDTNFNNYYQAIARTAEVEPDTKTHTTQTKALQAITKQLDQQYDEVKKLIQKQGLDLTQDLLQKDQPASQAYTSPQCDIDSFSTAISPLQVSYSLINSSRDNVENKAFNKHNHFTVDAKNFLTWIQTSHSKDTSAVRKANDIHLIQTFIQTDMFKASSTTIQGNIIHLLTQIRLSFKHANPIALVIKTLENDSSDTLKLILKSPHFRARLLDDDLLPTLETNEKTLWDHLEQHHLTPVKRTIIEQCFKYNAHDGMLDTAPAYLKQEPEGVFKKRWPAKQQLIVNPETDVHISFNETAMDHLHEHAKAVIASRLMPQAEEQLKQCKSNKLYYVTTDKDFSKCRGKEIDSKMLAKLCLFSTASVISSKPHITKPTSDDIDDSVVFKP